MTELTSPKGRFVSGNPYQMRTVKDSLGNPKVIRKGARAGEHLQQCFFALAVSKTDPDWPRFYSELTEIARTSFPQFFTPDGKCSLAAFAWKIDDGDGFTQKGKNLSEREGHAGCWIIKAVSSIPPTIYDEANADVTNQPGAVRAGDYGRFRLYVKGNDSNQSPGIYMNLVAVKKDGPGEEIVQQSDRNPEEMFGPSGATPGAPAPSAPITAPVAAAPAPAPAAPTPPEPYGGFIEPGLTLTEKGANSGFTLQQYREKGWTDDQLRAGGLAQ